MKNKINEAYGVINYIDKNYKYNKKFIKNKINNLISKGGYHFYFIMEENILFILDILEELKDKNYHIDYTLIIPYKNHYLEWKEKNIDRYFYYYEKSFSWFISSNEKDYNNIDEVIDYLIKSIDSLVVIYDDLDNKSYLSHEIIESAEENQIEINYIKI